MLKLAIKHKRELYKASKPMDDDPYGKHVNCVMPEEFGKTWNLPVRRVIITRAVFNWDWNHSSPLGEAMHALFLFIIDNNPELECFRKLSIDNQFNIPMGCASKLRLIDMKYYVSVAFRKRPADIEELGHLAKGSYHSVNTDHALNEDREKVSLHFVLSRETANEVLSKYGPIAFANLRMKMQSAFKTNA